MQLSEICEINPRTILVDESIDVSFVGMQDVSEDGAIYTGNVRPYQEVKKGYTAFEEDDVLFAKITPCMENGKGAVAKGLLNGKGAGSTEFHILRPICDRVNSDWLYYLTSFTGFRQSAERSMTGSAGQKRVPKTFLEKYKVDVPDISAQEHQVQSLNFLRDIIHQREQQIKVCDELIKARFVEMFGDPETNSFNWEECSLAEKLDVLGGYAFKSENFDEESGIPVLRIGNVNSGTFKPVNMVFWKEDSSLERYAIYPGDLVMSLTGTVGKNDYGNVCILGHDYEKYYLNQRNAKLEIKQGLEKLYLSQLLKFESIKKRLTGISRGVRQANISNKDILNLVVPIPPIEMQNQFANFVKQVDKSKVVIQKSLEETKLLFDSLMQRYFG